MTRYVPSGLRRASELGSTGSMGSMGSPWGGREATSCGGEASFSSELVDAAGGAASDEARDQGSFIGGTDWGRC